MTSVSEITLAAPITSPAERAGGDDMLGPTFSAWKPVEVPRPSRPSPVPLVILALLAGIGAMALGAVAVVAATRSADEPVAPAGSASNRSGPAQVPRVEQQVLALLAKPSTERLAFRGSGGRLLLVVGSGGRAAILVRGVERAPEGRPNYAWVVGSGKPVRAARFTGSERAIFLSVGVGRNDSVVVASERAEALRPTSARIVAVRG